MHAHVSVPVAQPVHVVTGAFSYSGRYLAQRLLDDGVALRTLTNHPRADLPMAASIDTHPLRFEEPLRLVEAMRGADVLYNTYWVRFDAGDATHARAVANTKLLFRAARDAGVRRIVHVSIANPERGAELKLPYYIGKAALEDDLRALGVSHAIVRPTVLFGVEDILINNIAYLLRRAPAFAVASGDYGVQPVFVDDQAALMQGLGRADEDTTVDAVGPEAYEFRELVALLAERLGKRRWIVTVPGLAVRALSWLMGLVLRDRLLTREELDGLRANLLVSRNAPTCPTSFRSWVQDHAATLGASYHNELRRHFRA